MSSPGSGVGDPLVLLMGGSLLFNVYTFLRMSKIFEEALKKIYTFLRVFFLFFLIISTDEQNI